MRGGALVMLAVVGTTLAALLAALTTALILLDRDTLDILRFWEVGAIANRDLERCCRSGAADRRRASPSPWATRSP